MFYIQNYTFKTRHIQNDHYPGKWELEGSFDDDKYHFIDSQNVTDLNENNKTKIFKVDTPNIFKYFKFHNFTATDGRTIFVIRSIDFFGYYVNERLMYGIPTCKILKSYNIQISIYIFILIHK